MTRIFSGLAVLSVLLLLANMTYGLLFGDFNAEASRLRAAHQQLEEARKSGAGSDADTVTEARRNYERVSTETRPIRQHAENHKLLGIAAAVVTVLVNSIVVTYFIGTSRWCQEVVDTYQLPSEFVQRSRRIKRRTFPWSLAGMLTMLAILGCGAAADPLSLLASSEQWVAVHLVVAIAGIVLIGFAYISQSGGLRENVQLIGQIMEEVGKARAARHLDSTSPDIGPGTSVLSINDRQPH
ncbi:MAG: MFS transporter [Planctomycetes bacterium]|nr:MFS transporter [Planctomycetota bacterium]